MSIAAHLPGLARRFDRQALRPPARPPESAAAVPGHGQATRAALLAWCWHGAAPGQASAAPPAAQPQPGLQLATAALCGADAAGTAAWADGFARELDGSTRLEALPQRAAGLAWRLRVKAQDAMPWRPRQPEDPWDAGWAIDTAPALQHLGSHFRPRRATLILAEASGQARLQPVLAALRQRQRDFRHPLRWLWVGGEGEGPAPDGLAVARFTLD